MVSKKKTYKQLWEGILKEDLRSARATYGHRVTFLAKRAFEQVVKLFCDKHAFVYIVHEHAPLFYPYSSCGYATEVDIQRNVSWVEIREIHDVYRYSATKEAPEGFQEVLNVWYTRLSSHSKDWLGLWMPPYYEPGMLV